jgi:hypothetical protein
MDGINRVLKTRHQTGFGNIAIYADQALSLTPGLATSTEALIQKDSY